MIKSEASKNYPEDKYIRIDANLHRTVKVEAAKKDKSIKEFVEAAIRIFLAQTS